MFRQIAFLLVAGMSLLAPYSASAASVNFFGPIVDERCRCETETTGYAVDSAPDWPCVIITIQNAVAVGITFIVVLITLVIAYSGIMIMAAPNNAEHRSAGKKMVQNAVTGLIIVLTAWLIVDFVMKAFYNDSKAGETLGKAEALPWNSIFSDDIDESQLCFEPRGSVGTQEPSGTNGGVVPGTTAPVGGATPANSPPAVSTNGTATKRPPTPGGFSGTASGTTVTLMWNDVSDTSVDWYVLERGLSGGSYKEIKRVSTDENIYADSGLTAGTKYYYRLFTWNEQGFSVGVQTEVTTEGTAPGSTGGTSCAEPTVSVDGGVIVSTNALTILKTLLKSACLTSARVTSGYRDPANQARAMYENIVSTSVSKQKELYGTNGDKVIDVYVSEKAAGKNETQIKSAMEAKIWELGPGKVSAHSDQAHNTFDVAPSSISSSSKFETALKNAKSAGTIFDYILPPKDQSYHIEATSPI